LYAIGLGASYTFLGFIISVYGAVQLITQILIGRSSDKRGRKPPGGVGASAVWPLSMALIIDKVSSEREEPSWGAEGLADM
jgi:DHA1 family multidrug resistance protein-like MFS transporter